VGKGASGNEKQKRPEGGGGGGRRVRTYQENWLLRGTGREKKVLGRKLGKTHRSNISITNTENAWERSNKDKKRRRLHMG